MPKGKGYSTHTKADPLRGDNAGSKMKPMKRNMAGGGGYGTNKGPNSGLSVRRGQTSTAPKGGMPSANNPYPEGMGG